MKLEKAEENAASEQKNNIPEKLNNNQSEQNNAHRNVKIRLNVSVGVAARCFKRCMCLIHMENERQTYNIHSE